MQFANCVTLSAILYIFLSNLRNKGFYRFKKQKIITTQIAETTSAILLCNDTIFVYVFQFLSPSLLKEERKTLQSILKQYIFVLLIVITIVL